MQALDDLEGAQPCTFGQQAKALMPKHTIAQNLDAIEDMGVGQVEDDLPNPPPVILSLVPLGGVQTQILTPPPPEVPSVEEV